MDKIKEFQDQYRFLSNFYGVPVTYNNLTFGSNEAAFQAQKDPSRSEEFTNLTPNKAKALGRQVKLRDDWNNVRLKIMEEINIIKFTENEYLKKKLIETGDRELIEGNYWNDTYWGVCRNVGENNLGKILMKIRESIK